MSALAVNLAELGVGQDIFLSLQSMFTTTEQNKFLGRVNLLDLQKNDAKSVCRMLDGAG